MSQNVYSKIQTQNTYGFMLNRECTNDFFTNVKTTGQEFSIYAACLDARYGLSVYVGHE